MQSPRLTLMQRLASALYPRVNSELPSFLALGGVRHKIFKPRYTGGPRNVGEEPQVPVEKYTGFNYYPRYPDQVDPPYEPTKLFAIKRIRALKGRPYWERHVVEGVLGLANRRTVAIVKNTPSNNAQLYRVKHLVEILPITFPNGMPTDAKNGFLKENGEFVVYNQLKPAGADSIEEVEADVEALRKRSVDGNTLRIRLASQWYSRW